MLAAIFSIVALVVIYKVTNKILRNHPCKNKIGLGMGASYCILIFASIFFLTSYYVKSGADELDKMRSPSYIMGLFAGEELVGDLLSAADEYEIDIDEEIGVEEMSPEMRLMMDNVYDNYSFSAWCLVVILAAFCVNVYGVLKTNKVVIWSSIAVMVIGLVISGRLAGVGAFHLLGFSTSGFINPYNGDTSDSYLIPFFTIVAAIIAIWCGIHGFRKTKALVEYNPDIQKSFVGKAESQPLYNPQPSQTYTQPQSTKANLQDYKEKAIRLQEVKELYDMQALTQEEYETMKHKILNS